MSFLLECAPLLTPKVSTEVAAGEIAETN